MNSWKGSNRRKFPRVNYPCLITVRQDKGADVILTHTENVGVGGVCVILNREIRVATPVTLEIDLLDTTNHIKSSGRVVWSLQRGDKEKKKPAFWDIGIEFTQLEDRDLAHLDEIVRRLVKQGHQTPYV